MAAEDAHAGDIVDAAAQQPPLSAARMNELLRDIAHDIGARADALLNRVYELDGEFEARAAAGDDDADATDLRARLAELSRMGEELYVEFETRLMDLDVMVMDRLAEIRAAGEDEEEVEAEDLSEAAAELFEEDDSD